MSDDKEISSLASLSAFLRAFIDKNASKKELARIRKWKYKGYHFPFVLRPVKIKGDKDQSNVLSLPRRNEEV